MSQATQNALRANRRTASYRKWKRVLRNWQLYVFLIPTILYFLVFRYYPMYGLQIAFRNYKASKGIWGSQWVGFRNFQRFFATADFWQLLENTLAISVGNLLPAIFVPMAYIPIVSLF